MSLNNGVYVVEFEDCRRIIHTPHIQNLFFYNRHTRENDYARNLYLIFKDKKSFELEDFDETMYAATQLYRYIEGELNIHVEHGIQIIQANISWRRIVEIMDVLQS